MITPHDLSLEDVLPQRGAMLLIERIVECTPCTAVTESFVRPSWPLAGPRGVEALILVEVAAQSAGVCCGWDRIQTQGLDSKQEGWIVAVKQAEFHLSRLPFGALLRTRAETTLRFDKFREMRGEVHMESKLLAQVILQLYQP